MNYELQQGKTFGITKGDNDNYPFHRIYHRMSLKKQTL